MRQENKLKEKIGNKVPYKVPEGYFESFRKELVSNLPEYPAVPEQPKLSRWHKIRPYVYLAAMFAGIWCMMQVFHRVSNSEQQRQETVLASYEPDSYDLYVDESLGDDFKLEDELVALYPSMEEFKKDFYAQL